MIDLMRRFFDAAKRADFLEQQMSLLAADNKALQKENEQLRTLVRALRDVNAHLDQRLLNVGGMA